MKKDITNLYEEQKRERFIHIEEMMALLCRNEKKIREIKKMCDSKAARLGMVSAPRGYTYRKFFNELTDPEFAKEK